MTIRRPVLNVLLALVLIAGSPAVTMPAPALAQTSSIDPSRQEGDDIVVIGARSGPRLWRVTREDSEVFVLVGVSYIPDDLEWNDTSVARILEETSEVLVMPTADVGAGNRARLIGTMLRTLIFNRSRIMMPKDTTLADKVGADLAGQFSLAKAKVAARKQRSMERGENDKDQQAPESDGLDRGEPLDDADASAIEKQLAELEPERLHPFFQAQGLMSDAIDSADLKGFNAIERQVKKLARRTEKRPRPDIRPIAEFDVAFRDVKTIIKAVKDFSEATNRACISEAITFANDDLYKEVLLSEAWAHGDAGYLRANANEPALSPCGEALSEELGSLKTLGNKSLAEFDGVGIWVDALTDAMREPGTRLAIVSADTWLREGGAMDRLTELGYTIFGP